MFTQPRAAAAVTTSQRTTAVLPGRVENAKSRGPHKWAVDGSGRIANFNMKLLRNDILFRLQSGENLYTLEECRVFILEMARLAARWQEGELANLQYLCELHTKVLPGRQLVYQFPPAAIPNIPYCPPHDQMADNPLYKITKVVEELNRSLVRMIDQLWADRRERLLLASRLLKDLEAAVNTK